MPNLIPKSGPARIKAGLGSVPLDGAEIEANLLRRSACALVAILPYECAEFILRDPPAMIESRPSVDTARRMVDNLSDVSGAGAIDTATSVLGNLLAWCIANRPKELMLCGSTCADYFEANPPSTNTNAGFVWLWDWCGIDLPARTAVTACLRGVAPGSSNRKSSGVLKILIGLERTARYSKNAFEACHAAGWALMMRCALRFKQSVGLVINAIVKYYHEPSQRTFTLLSASILKDKNKNKEKQRPRPVWCVVDALDGSSCRCRFPQPPRDEADEFSPAFR